ncbi:hypothetical protein B0T10DRAFT_469029 [Thelonectria olida]|uniref:COP9 signalosome complex subunit 3 N-terminal helical repeats domain-containing protein n=1 Tax=Thelonectria olida TaxID=1576542 RepID=A0A9P9AZ35_9HYPO|nr:hypothetical protein B0T10DRAFT_469029 [Thelonectria olida]
MDSVWAVLSTFSAAPGGSQSTKEYDLAIKDHVQAIKQLLFANRQVVTTNFAEILANLDPANNSIAFLAILLITWDNNPTGPERSTLLDETLRFLLKFDPSQVRYTGQSFRKLLEDVVRGQRFSPLVSVEAVTTAMLRLDPSGCMFTSTHLMLAKLAYETSWIDPALPVLDSDVLFFPGMVGQREGKLLCDPSLTPVSYVSVDTGLTDSVRSSTVLEYNLVSALCYMTKKDWTKAHRALERVLSHPSRDKGVSKFMDVAHKQWVLVGLLKDGKEPTLPSHVASAAKSSFETLGLPYKNVAGLFSMPDAARLKAEVEVNRQVWEEDNNVLLINEVLAAYQKWQIINLRDVYTQVSISQLRQMTVSAETGEALKDDGEMVQLVRQMIESNLLKGVLDEGQSGEDSYLKFLDDNEYLPEADLAQRIAQHAQSIERLGRLYKAANDRLGNSKEYVKHLVREQKRAEKDVNDPGLGFDSQIEDEDLMTGILAHG